MTADVTAWSSAVPEVTGLCLITVAILLAAAALCLAAGSRRAARRPPGLPCDGEGLRPAERNALAGIEARYGEDAPDPRDPLNGLGPVYWETGWRP